MRLFRLLGARRIRLQPLRAAIAVVAVASGVTLAVAILVTSTSVDRSVTDFGRALAGPAPLRIVGPTTRGGLTPGAVEAAEAVPGVDAVIPMVQAVTLADTTEVVESTPTHQSTRSRSVPVLALGVDCRVEALVGVFGCDEAALGAAGDGVLAIGDGLAAELGPGATLRTDLGRLPLDGVPAIAGLDALSGGRVAIFSLAGAGTRFLQGDLVDVAYVLPAAGVDLAELRRSLGSAVGEQNGVLSGDDPPPETQIVLLTFLPLFSLLGLFGLGTGAVLVHNTVQLSLEERRRQLAVIGALGATRRTIVGGALGEAALLGMLGGALGTLGGIAVAGPIVGSLSNFTESIAGVSLARHTPPSVAVLGMLLGGLVGAASAIGPVRRVTRMDVAAELSGRGARLEAKPLRAGRRLAVFGTIAVVAVAVCWASARDGGIEAWQATVGPLAFLVVAIAVPLAGGALSPLLLDRAAASARGSRRGAVVLAFAELVRDPRRTAVMVVAIASPVIIGFATDGFVTSARRGIEASFASAEGVSVSTIDVNEGIDAFLSPDAQAALAALPGVAAVEHGVFVAVGTDFGSLLGVDAFTDPDLADVDMIEGTADLDRLMAGEALIGPGLARRTGARPGDTIELPAPGGIVEVPVQGIVEDGDFGGMRVTLSYDRLLDLYGPQPPAFVVVEPAPGVSEDQLAATIRSAAPTIDPELRAITTAELVDDIVGSIDEQMLPFRAMQRALQFVAFVAVLSTLLLAGLQRQREHGLLAAAGAGPAELRRIVLAEAGLAAGVAVIAAAVLGPIVLWSMLQVIPILIGNRNPFEADWSALVGGGVVAIAGALLAAAWPAWRAGRTDVLEALRYE